MVNDPRRRHAAKQKAPGQRITQTRGDNAMASVYVNGKLFYHEFGKKATKKARKSGGFVNQTPKIWVITVVPAPPTLCIMAI